MSVHCDHQDEVVPRQSNYVGLIAELRRNLPILSILDQMEDVKPYECDGLSAYRQVPRAVILPRTESDLKRVLEAWRQHRVPVVVRGAGTGLSGGAMPHAEGVVVSLARFMQILEIDPQARTARVQPGVRNLALSKPQPPQSVLRTRSFIANCLHPWWKCRREFGRRALP